MGRNFGQDSYMTSNKESNKIVKSNNKSIIKIIRYYFDNSISRGSTFVFYLVLLSFVLGLVMTGIQNLMDTNVQGDFFDKWWSSVTKILKLGKGNTWKDRFVEFLFWALSIALSGAVIGFLTSKINQIIESLKRGKSDIIAVNHIVIIGWSKNIVAILRELSIANESNKGVKIVIFSSRNNLKMQEEIETFQADVKNLKIITRSGDSTNPDELKILNLNESKSIILLNEQDDSLIVTTLLSLLTLLENNKVSIILSLKNRSYYDSIKRIKGYRIIPVMVDEVSANITAQVCRYRGLGVIFLDFLDFEGDEIYFQSIEKLNGKSYGEAIMYFEKSSIIGIYTEKEGVLLNPNQERIIKNGDKLIVISEDDSTISTESNIIIANSDVINNLKYELKRINKKILFVGWSILGKDIINSYDSFLSEGSIIDVVFNEKELIDQELESKVQINFIPIFNETSDIINQLNEVEYDEVILLASDNDNLSIDYRDTSTLLKMLLIDTNRFNLKFPNFRVVAQLLDSSKAKLADTTFVEELVVSDNLSALLISQLVENNNLKEVFDELFSSSGASINLFPLSKYINSEKEIKYADIVYSASLKNESAIGLRFGADNVSSQVKGVVLNPRKSFTFIPNSEDKVIVISER